MMDNLEAQGKALWKERMIAKHGSWEKVQEVMREIRSKRVTNTGGGFRFKKTQAKATETRNANRNSRTGA